MKDFKIEATAVSRKVFHIQARTEKDAMDLASAILEHTTLLDFSEEDVDTVQMTCQEECGGVCKICTLDCEFRDADEDK